MKPARKPEAASTEGNNPLGQTGQTSTPKEMNEPSG